MDAGTGAGGKKAAADAMPWRSNAGKRSVESGEILKYCPLGLEEQEFLEQASEQAGLSMRGCHRVIRVARTIADLEGKDRIGVEHLGQALFFRNQNVLRE